MIIEQLLVFCCCSFMLGFMYIKKNYLLYIHTKIIYVALSLQNQQKEKKI